MTAWLLDTFIYTGLLIALVLVLRRPVSRHFGPQIAYMLWVLPFLRLLLPPVVLPASLAPEPVARPDLLVAAVPAEGSPSWSGAAAFAADPVAPAARVPVVEPAETSAPVWEWADLGQIALALWLLSAAVFLAWRVVMYRRMRAELLAGARPVGEIGKVRLIETPAIAAPVAFGVLDKVIALPPLFMAQPDTMARDLAIQHELQHHRGHDLLANMAAQALLALHWLNPLAWYGWRAMRRDQEAACDARVLAGRGRDERALYAALIVDIAAGPRLALAAPMACPVLGDKSVIHRLRSMSMSDITPGRRWLGRGLIATAATLALPLTASISYAVANAQEPVAPVSPEAPLAPIVAIDPDAPDALSLPGAPEAADRGGGRAFVMLGEGEGGLPETLSGFGRYPAVPPEVPMPPVPPIPRIELQAWGGPTDPEFEKRMEDWGKEMEKWGEEYGAQWEKWGEEQGARALAWSEQARRNAPEIVQSCDAGERRRVTTDDGRARVVICPDDHARAAALAGARAEAQALASLRRSRSAIANTRGMSDSARREVLQSLDEEIRRMERGGN